MAQISKQIYLLQPTVADACLCHFMKDDNSEFKMPDITKRNLLKTGIATSVFVIFSQLLRAEDKSTLSGSGKDTIEKFLTLQEGALEENATVQQFTQATAPRIPANLSDRILMWNEISLGANALDYVKPLEAATGYHQQFGPHKSSRAIAMVQLAVFEVVNARFHDFKSYTGFSQPGSDWSVDAAVAQSSHDMLVHLYPPQDSRLAAILADDLIRVVGLPTSVDAGRKAGTAAYNSVLTKIGDDHTG